MNRCEEDEWVDDYAEGGLPPEQSRRIERHLVECDACRQTHDGIVALRRLIAELPQGLEPERDLWPKIAGQIAAIPAGKRRLGFLVGWRAIAMAASILIAVGATALIIISRSDDNISADIAAIERKSSDREVNSEVAKAEEAYTDAANSLLADLQSTKVSLTPAVRQSLESNLAVTNQAISDIKSALAQHPNDLTLARKLFVAHERRVELLLDVAQFSLSNRNGG